MRRPDNGKHHALTQILLATLLMICVGETSADEWETLFDGQSLHQWDGDPSFWRVEDGAITGETTPEKALDQNSFLIWQGGYLDDFELRLRYKITSGNSGIQYRSFELADGRWRVGGYQADLEAGNQYSGILYGERFRGTLAERGTITTLSCVDGELKKSIEAVGDAGALQQLIHQDDWNEYHIVANGYRFQHYINGVLMSECLDRDQTTRRAVGILALQLHTGPPMKVQFNDIRLRKLPVKKKIVLIAGTKSHGFGEHEHRAGCLLLSKALNESGLPVSASVIANGWPNDLSVLYDADAIVVYADGGKSHPILTHLDELRRILRRGTGLVCLHYAVEIPKGPAGTDLMKWIGGYFETNWSVNPHWTADYASLPPHPITRGVAPFTLNDEWYYHMRFPDGNAGWTPILTSLPPAESLTRPDGPHSNNPAVRAAVLERREPQHMAWAVQRCDGGRGFGCTGGHFHWGWGHNDFRKLILNAVCWSAHLKVPTEGVASRALVVEDLLQNQDFAIPIDFNPDRIESQLRAWNRTLPP